MITLNKIKNNLLIYVILIFLFYLLIIKLLNIFILISGYDCNLVLNVISIPSGESSSSEPVDPVRWWPSGVPQGIAAIASSIGVYGALTKLNASPRLRVIGALASAGVTSSHIIYNSALESSVGFNRLMVGITQYKETGKWPTISDMSNNSSDEVVKDFIVKNVTSTIETEAMKKAKEIIAIDSNSTGGTNSFLPKPSDGTNLMESIQDYFFKGIFELFKPVPVEGYLDDLLGQRLFIESVLFFLCICIFILFILFIFNLYIYINKESILSKNTYNIRIINLYLKYQIIITKISLIVFTFFILFGLYTLCQGFHWLITHQIPYYSLDIDLHQYVSSSALAQQDFSCASKSNVKYAFLFPFIIDKLINIPGVKDSNDPVIIHVIAIATLQIFILIGFINIIMNILALYILENLTASSALKEKYPVLNSPKFIKIINYFGKTSKLTIIIETIIVISIQIFIIVLNYFIAIQIILHT